MSDNLGRLTHLNTNDDYVNQACAELAFAKAMGFEGWTHDQEQEPGVVRGFRVVWSRSHDAPGFFIPPHADLDDRYVFVTGALPNYRVHGWTTLRIAMEESFAAPAFAEGDGS